MYWTERSEGKGVNGPVVAKDAHFSHLMGREEGSRETFASFISKIS